MDEPGHRLFPHWFLPEMFLSKIKNIICVLELSTKNITVEASLTGSLRVGENPGNEVGAGIVLTSEIRGFTERVVN